MIVALSKKVRILAEDGKSFTLVHQVEREKKSTGEKYEDWENVGYYGTLKQVPRRPAKELLGAPSRRCEGSRARVRAHKWRACILTRACEESMESAALAQLEGLEGSTCTVLGALRRSLKRERSGSSSRRT